MTIAIDTKSAIETHLLERGADIFSEPDSPRIYLNNWPELAGLDFTRHESGSVRSASLAGEWISNSRAKAALSSLQVYYDCERDDLVVFGTCKLKGRIEKHLRKALEMETTA